MVRPSSSSFFCPPERFPASSPATRSSLRNSMTSSARARMAASWARIFPGRSHTSMRVSPDWPAGTVMRFSRTVSVENSWAIWKVRSTPLPKSSWGVRPVTSSPSR